MLIQYKRNKKYARFNSNSFVPDDRPEPSSPPCGPFASCGNCPYPSHGFICYSGEGDCLKTDIAKDAIETEPKE